MLGEGRYVGIVEAVFGLLQQDKLCPGFSATDEYTMYPQFGGTHALGPLEPSIDSRGQVLTQNLY